MQHSGNLLDLLVSGALIGAAFGVLFRSSDG
jgi:hypothetical protein